MAQVCLNYGCGRCRYKNFTSCCGKCPYGHTDECNSRRDHERSCSLGRGSAMGQQATQGSRGQQDRQNPLPQSVRRHEASPLPSDQSRGRQEILPGCHVVVHSSAGQKTKFAAGDQGIVVEVNPKVPNCAVSFSGKSSEPVWVAQSYLRIIDSPSDGSNFDVAAAAAVKNRDPSIIRYKDHKETRSSANPGSLARDESPCRSIDRKNFKDPQYGADSEFSAKHTGWLGHATGAGKQSYVPDAHAHRLHHQCLSSDEKLLLKKDYVLGEQLSDHLPQIFICGANAGRVRVLTWNIMTQCRHTRCPNNGFGKSETHDDYLKRLGVIGFFVAEFFAQYEAGVATLQECPLMKEDQQAFISAIEQNFQKKGKKLEFEVMKSSGVLANVTLWDGFQWRRKQTDDAVRALITKLDPVCGVRGAAPCTFVNVHLEWKANPDDKAYREHASHVAGAVRRFLEAPGLVVVAGDFNMNVVACHQILVKHCKSAVVEKIDHSSQVWKDGRPVANTVDGVIWQDIAK